MALAIALTALIISGTSLWLSVLRPAKFSMTFLDEHTRVGTGGQNGLPAITEIRGFVALANMGAQAGLLQRIEIGIPFVTPSRAHRFAMDIEPNENDRPLGLLDGDPLAWPKTIEAGDVRVLEVNFGLDGDLRRARLEAHDAEPDRKLLAELVRDLESVSIPLIATYRRGRQPIAVDAVYCSVRIPGTHFKRAAMGYWNNAGHDDLAEIVGEAFADWPD